MNDTIFVFDTNVISVLIRDRNHQIFARIRRIESTQLILCEPIIYEIERGLLHREAYAKLQRFREDILPLFLVVSLQIVDWRAAAQLWAYTQARGRQLSDTDLLLAAVTVRLKGNLITDDRDFEHLPMIVTENWLLSP